MSTTQWTPSQEAALSARGGNLLLSAAAGSGKTAVLVERLIRRITDPKDPVPVNAFLVLTFTRAAASEMQSRIGQALSDTLRREETAWLATPTEEGRQRMVYLEQQIALLGSASISTIDAFCQSVLRQYFYLLDIAPDFRILSDENEKYLLQDDVLSEVLLHWYDSGRQDFHDLVDLFAASYQDSRLRSLILGLYSFSRSLAFPETFLRKLPEPYDAGGATSPDGFPWVKDLLASFRDKAEGWTRMYLRMFDLMEGETEAFKPYQDILGEEYAAVSSLLGDGNETWEAWYTTMNKDLFQRLKAVSKKDIRDPASFDEKKGEIQDLRAQVKKEYQDLQKMYFSVSPRQWAADMTATRPLAQVLSEVALDFTAAYEARKKKEGLMEFNDMEHAVLRLLLAKGSTEDHLIPSDTALALRDKYREVMVDEYQDTNSLQELITVLISGGTHRFLVGDIKQSIYRFRQADPSIFLEKYQSFSADSPDKRRIDLNRNFRSDPAILTAANFIFRQLFGAEGGPQAPLSLAYGDAEALYPGRPEKPAPAGYIGGTVDIDILETAVDDEESEGQDLDKTDLEARLIARRIERFMDGTHLVMDKDGSFRPIQYRDMVILLRAVETKASILLKTLRSRGIPAVCDQKDDFFSAPEVQILWAMLKILDNPHQDLALSAVLRSPMVGLADESLARLRLADRDSLWNALQEASDILPPAEAMGALRFRTLYGKWRRLSRQIGIAPLVETILTDTDFLAYWSGLPGSAFRRAHILSFYEAARAYDSQSMSGLYRFLLTLENAEKSGKSFQQAGAPRSEANAVRIMTIHKSKGLEFPLVFLAAANTKFNLRDAQSMAVYTKDKGIGLPRFDRDHLCCWPTLYSYAIRHDIRRETLAEEARLLYVAMTRTKDKLIITGTVKDTRAALGSWTRDLEGANALPIPPLPAYRVTSAASYLDWILPAALRSRSMASVWDEDGAGGPPAFVPGHAQFSCRFHKASIFLTAEEKGNAAPAPSSAADDFLKDHSAPPAWIEERFSWTYAHEGAVTTPAKLTATAAVQLEEADKEEFMPSKVLAPNMEEKQSLPPDFAAPPDFLAGEETRYQGTSFGTLMHKAMEKLDFHTLTPSIPAIQEEIRRLTALHTFTEDEARILLSRRYGRYPVADILKFMESTLGILMKRAAIIRKELPFSILLPARQFYPQCEEGETIFLQGAIDCLLEKDNKLVIIDYKTDRVPDGETLAAHYHRQIQIYGASAEKILGKPVAAMYLWSFHLTEAVRVRKQEEMPGGQG